MVSRYEQVFNNTSQYLGFLDPNGTILEANETALAVGDLDHEDVVGEKLWETYWLRFSDDARRVREDIKKAAWGHRVNREIRVRGEERPFTVDFSIRPLVDARENVTRLVCEGYCIERSKRRGAIDRQIRRGLPRSNLLVSYSRKAGQDVSETVLEAFLAIGVDIFEFDTTLHEWISSDALDGFDWDSAPPHVITTRIWGYNVGISADEIRIYSE